MTLTLYNTLTRRKETFQPIDPGNVRMYACGPTVYDYVHIGNGRMAVVFDLLFRVLRHLYGPGHVTYARNITDVDDKINARAAESGIAIGALTTTTARQYQEDVAALGCLPPTVEPRATEHIGDMRTLIELLVANGHAYVAEDHVLFHVPSMPDYGKLSNRSLDEMEAGARVDVAPYKRDPMDFVLWKPSKAGQPSWPSPGGIGTPGRPGWHIECSAMAEKHLGRVFDIHGGGIDLVFPHHENELAQSRCAHGTPVMANYWLHNGFLTAPEGEKMSKSLGNFTTIHALLQQWPGEALRLALLSAHYRQPLPWTERVISDARMALRKFAHAVRGVDPRDRTPCAAVVAALSGDLNTPLAIAELHRLTRLATSSSHGDDPLAAKKQLAWSLEFLGFESFKKVLRENTELDEAVSDAFRAVIDQKVTARSAARKAKDFKESDRIRDELAAMGVQLKDAKDPATGEIVTTWEVRAAATADARASGTTEVKR